MQARPLRLSYDEIGLVFDHMNEDALTTALNVSREWAQLALERMTPAMIQGMLQRALEGHRRSRRRLRLVLTRARQLGKHDPARLRPLVTSALAFSGDMTANERDSRVAAALRLLKCRSIRNAVATADQARRPKCPARRPS